MKIQPLLIIIAFVALITLASCADANIAQENAGFCAREMSGFWSGLWHGCVAPFAFFGSLFKPDIAIYDICNIGGWYDFGFCIGVGAFGKGSHSAGRRWPKRWSRRRETDLD